MSDKAATQSDIMRKNISAIAEIERKHLAEQGIQDRVANVITRFAGSMWFIYVHVIWFGLWILLNIGLIHIPHISEFDPFPFGLLTMVVSLEAIFLSAFILVSQNRMSKMSEQRSELDLHVNLLAEQKATKVLEVLDQIAKQLDSTSKRFNFKTDPEIEALKVSPQPQEVLEVIQEAVSAEVAEKIEDAIEDVTGETKIVREEVRDVSAKLDEVAVDVDEIKEEVKRQTGEHERTQSK